MLQTTAFSNGVKKTRSALRLIEQGEFYVIYQAVLNRGKQHYKNRLANKQGVTEEEAINRIDAIRYKMTTMGHTERALAELRHIIRTQKHNPSYRRLAATEMATWLIRQHSKSGGALKLIRVALKDKSIDAETKQKLHIIRAEAYMVRGHRLIARTVLRVAHGIDRSNFNVHLATANTYKTLGKKIGILNSLYSANGFDTIRILNARKPLDTIEPNKAADKLHKDRRLPLVTVAVGTYNNEDFIATTLRSLQAQNHTNLEIIVVDDSSTDDTVKIVKKFTEEDDRMQLLSKKENSGTYVSRNLALKKARGEFFTVLDGDDWLHPDAIATQVKHFKKLPKGRMIGVVINGIRVFDHDLSFFSRGSDGRYVNISFASLMFRRQELLNTFGAWDEVRFSADSEMVYRLLRKFGDEALQIASKVPLALFRQHDNSLTSHSHFGNPNLLMGARKSYKENHILYTATTQDYRYKINQERKFYAPKPMRNDRSSPNNYDVIFVADFRDINLPGTKEFYLETLKQHTNTKTSAKIGLVQAASYDTSSRRDTGAEIRKELQANDLEFIVYGESVKTSLLVIHAPSIREYQHLIPRIEAKQAILLACTPKEIETMGRHPEKQSLALFGVSQKITWCIYSKQVHLGSSVPTGVHVYNRTWIDITRAIEHAEYAEAFRASNTHMTSKPKLRSLPENIFIEHTSKMDDAEIKTEDVVVVMPAITLEKAKRTAELLVSRAGINCSVVIAIDDLRQGFIKTLNQTALKVRSKYIVYLAEDVIPGRNWLKIAYESLESANKNILGFNDGKWQGRIASFGMVNRDWVYSFYGQKVIFNPYYHSHGCDNELTVIARVKNTYVYEPNATLIENDAIKDIGGSNPYDYLLFRKRFREGFDGRIPLRKLEPLAQEYGVKDFTL